MFGKSKDKAPKQEEQKEDPKVFSRSEEISKNYKQLGECCEILSKIQRDPNDIHGAILFANNSGWRVWSHTLIRAGIDIEKVYECIESLSQDRKSELERELAKVEESQG